MRIQGRLRIACIFMKAETLHSLKGHAHVRAAKKKVMKVFGKLRELILQAVAQEKEKEV